MGPILEWIASLDESPLDTVPVESSLPLDKEKASSDGAPLPDDMPSLVTDEEGMSSEEVIEPVPPELPPIEEEREESIFAQLIGVVGNIRKMQTKSGGMMMVATVETIGFDFRIVIFPKEYEKYESKIEEDMIVVVDGRIKFDRESGEVSIFPSAGFGKKQTEGAGAVKCFSITVFREMAMRSGMVRLSDRQVV